MPQLINQAIGRFSSWLIFFMMILTVVTVVLRYGFGIGSIALQEMANYCHASAFLLAAAYTLRADEHVRVDIFYNKMNAKQKAWVDALGCIGLLIPFSLFLILASWPFFVSAWEIKESSAEAGGLAFVYLLKGLIPLSMLFLLLEAFGLLIKNAKTLVR